MAENYNAGIEMLLQAVLRMAGRYASPILLPLSMARLAACAGLILGFTATAAPLVTPQQLTVTAANAAGDSIYNLTLATGSAPNAALISGTQALNTDDGKHGSFDALVWAPNSFTGTLDLIVADVIKGQILRYSGPNYGTATAIFTFTGKGSGPANPVGLSVDSAGNLFAISPNCQLDSAPSLWVLPFNKATGIYGAPVLIDHTFSGAKTLALADVLVAGSPATADGGAAPAWHTGDVLVLVGDTFDSRVIVYSQASISRVLANPKVPLTGPTSTAISSTQFSALLAVPFGMDLWPADATHGVSLLFTTIDGRIVRFDSSRSTFTSNFASGLGLGLQKIKVGVYASTPYAFVAQIALPAGGKILQFGAPPASGTNKPLATVNKGVSDPIGLAVSSSGSQPASSCAAPYTCSILGPQITQQVSGPGAANIPAGATILEQSCIVQSDPRVAIVNGAWSCLGPTINVCGSTPTPGCVPPTLDVANYCPGFPSTILPPSFCGHAGPTGSGFEVVKGTAELFDKNANDLYIQTAVDATVALPGPFDQKCQQGPGQYGPLYLWAPRSDLPSIEGTIVEDQSAPYFIDLTGFCDTSGGNSHVASMFAFGIGLNTAASGLGSGPSGGLFGFVTGKFNNLANTIADASAQITPSVLMTLENYVTQSQTYFDNDYQHDVDGYSCALNSIASADSYLRNEAQTDAFTYTPPAGGNNNPNRAGAIDARFGNLYLTISGDFLFTPNPGWPTINVPPCVTLAVSTPTVAAGGRATLVFGPPTPMFATTPLTFAPAQCMLTLSAPDGTVSTTPAVGTAGSITTAGLTQVGAYTATLECTGAAGDTATSLATATITVAAQPPPVLQILNLSPSGPQTLTEGASTQLMVIGGYSDGSTQNLTGVANWTSSMPAVATVSTGAAGGLVTAVGPGQTTIGAAYGGVSAASTTVNVPTPSATLTPSASSVTIGTIVQLSWSSSGLAPGTTCTLTSNSSDNALDLTNQASSGMASTTENVPQTVTYTLACPGLPASATAAVTYTLQTTYQYTGKAFQYYYTPYTSFDSIIASMTLSSPLPPNATLIDPTVLPGFQLTMSDGVQTLQPLTLTYTNNSDTYVRVSTDSNGNIIGPWTVGFNNNAGPNQAGMTTQYDTGGGDLGFSGTDDVGYQGTHLCSADCGQNFGPPGTWSSTNVQNLHVIYGTVPGSNPPAAQLYEVTVAGMPSSPTLTAGTLLSETPEPTTCLANGQPAATGGVSAITALAFLPNAASGTLDVAAANAGGADVFRLTGPSYQPASDINNASPNCGGDGAVAAGLAADAAGDVLGVGHYALNTANPALYLFPTTQPGTVFNDSNYVLMDSVNFDPLLTSCPSTPSGCVSQLVDASVASAANAVNGVGVGDLLVLVGDAWTGNGNPIVLRLPAAAIRTAAAFASTCPASYGHTDAGPCLTNSNGSRLVTQSTLTLGSGEAPVSMDISPIDGSLLVATSFGNIYQLQATAGGYGSAKPYATGQPGIQRIRAGQRAGILYVFATVLSEGSSIALYVGNPPSGGFNASQAIYAPASGNPSGLAVSSPPVIPE